MFQLKSIHSFSILPLSILRRNRSMDTTQRYLTSNILIVGKKNAGQKFIEDGCAEYEKRLTPSMTINTQFLKSDDALVEAVKASRGTIIALDENGDQKTSRAFSDYLFKAFENGGAHVTFVIGGFSGLPSEIKNNENYSFISLSKMTWTHQMARLLLLEQIYRGVEIRKNTGYHKD